MSELWAVAQANGVQIRILAAGAAPFPRDVGTQPKLLLGDIHPDDVLQNLDVVPIELGSDRSLFYGAGLRVPARSQWSIRGGVQPIWASPNYYDRNPKSLDFHVATGFIGPHAATTRWSYTVPAGRRAFIERGFSFVQMSGVPSVVSDRQSYLAHFPVGGGPGALFIFAVLTLDSGVIPGTRSTDDASTAKEMQAGDILQFVTLDLCTGGNAAYIGDAVGTEFDA